MALYGIFAVKTHGVNVLNDLLVLNPHFEYVSLIVFPLSLTEYSVLQGHH